VSLSVAVNDPAGTWRIAVRELCSGRHAEASFSVLE